MMESSLIDRLSGIVGPENVLSAPEDLLCYSFDATPGEARPECVVLPTTTEQVAAVVKLAGENAIPIYPRGAGSGLSGGSVPTEGGIALVLTKMDRILEINTDDLYVRCEPGVIVADLIDAVAEFDLVYPPDPSSMKSCTMGGAVAENAGGLRGLKYGVTKDYVIALVVVGSDGSVFKTGAVTVKSVSGYDLTKLFIGSFGTLGIITEVTFRTFALPEATAAWVFSHASFEDAWAFTRIALDAPVTPSILDILSPDATSVLARRLDRARPSQWTSIVAFEGGTEEVAAGEARAKREAGSDGLEVPPPGELRDHLRETPPNELWTTRWAVTVPPAAISPALNAFQRGGGRRMLCRPGTGQLFGSLFCADAHETIEAVSALSGEILDLGGHLVLESAPLEIRLQMDFENLVGDAGAVMQNLKRAFDPAGILNPGKFGTF